MRSIILSRTTLAAALLSMFFLAPLAAPAGSAGLASNPPEKDTPPTSAIAPRRAPAVGSISGRVTNEAGDAIQNVEVRVTDGDGGTLASGLTDALGRYFVGGFIAGEYAVQFDPALVTETYLGEHYDDTRAGCATRVNVIPPAETSGIDAVLTKAGSLSGTVTTGGATPVPNVKVIAFFDNGRSSRNDVTDINGEYLIESIPPGTARVLFQTRLEVTTQILMEKWYGGGINLETAQDVSISPGVVTANINANLSVGGSIAGTVTSDGVTPIAGVGVQARGNDDRIYSDRTNALGRYYIPGVPTGSYSLIFDGNLTGYVTEWYNDKPSREAASPVAITAPFVLPGIDAVLAPGGTISGSVSDGIGPVAGILVFAYDAHHKSAFDVGSTGASGAYEIRGLPPGDYRVEFSANGGLHHTSYYPGVSRFQDATPVSVSGGSIRGGINAVLDPFTPGGIEGTVSFQGGDCGNVQVNAIPTNSYTGKAQSIDYPNLFGDFSITGLPEGKYSVEFHNMTSGYQDIWYMNRPAYVHSNTVPVKELEITKGIDAVIQLEGSSPVVDLVAGRDTVKMLPPGTPLPLELSFSCATDRGRPVDYFLLARTLPPSPAYWFYYVPGRGWSLGRKASLSASCADFSEREITSIPRLPPGRSYVFYAGYDTLRNGILDISRLVWDGVLVRTLR